MAGAYPRSGSAGREDGAFQKLPHTGRAWWSGLLVLAGFTGLGMLATAAGAAVSPGGGPALAGGGWLAMTMQAGMDALPGIAAWLVWRRPDVGLHRKKAALRLWGWGLPVRVLLAAAAGEAHVGAAWSTPWNAEVAAALLLCGLTVLCFRAFWPLQRVAAAMLLPYMACIAAAAWLGASV